MYKELFVLAVGIIIGMMVMYYLLRSKLGDDYDIYKPKQRGNSNSMEIDQKNTKPLKTNKRRILERSKSKLKTKKR